MMRSNPPVAQSAVAIVTALSLALCPAAPLLAGQAGDPASSQASGSPKPAATPAPNGAPAAKPDATPPPVDGGWPRGYTTPSGGKIVVYQPQIASWEEQRHAVAYAAVSYEAKGAAKPALGSLKIETDTKVAVADRLVKIGEWNITESNFPTLPKEQMREVVAEIDKSIPDEERVIGRDGRLLQIRTGGESAAQVIRVEVERDAGTPAEPGLEREPALQRPSARGERREACHQPFEASLAPENVGRDPELARALAQLRLDGSTKGRSASVLTHRRRPPGWPARRAA